jgi:hypothetical protein
MAKLTNTNEFRRAARAFQDKGYYIDAPSGSQDFYEFWMEELRRCREGYTVGGMHITGNHYFYLNYVQMKIMDMGNKKGGAIKKVDFPGFWDGDYEYFHLMEIARNGTTREHVNSLGLSTTVHDDWLDGGHHMIVGKARRKGFSYKNAAITCNQFNTIKDSYTLLCAHDKKYLYPKGIMTMAAANMDYLNEHTGWSKRRSVIDKQNHKKASYLEYINNQPVEKGYKSEVEAITFKDNPDAARGKDASLVIFEEAGAFDNLKDTYMATRPCVEDGGITTGQMIIFGTGGDMEGGTIDFESMFYNPEPYNLMPVENVWDDGGQGTHCGWFFPSYRNKIGFMDKDGNTFEEDAKHAETVNRESTKKNSKDAKVYDKLITEYPWKPREAFLQSGSNMFPTAELVNHRNFIMRSGKTAKVGTPGILVEAAEGVKFRPSDQVRPIEKFPHQKGDDITGAVVVYQSPYRDEEGQVPNNLYFIAHDPYAHDSSVGNSLGSAYVFKRANPLSKPDDMIVASYVGRPETQDEYNDNLFKLAAYYNARIGFENDRGNVIPYAKQHKKLHWLMVEVELFDKANGFKARTLGRNYGLSMGSKHRKAQAVLYLRDWLRTKRSMGEDGASKLNLHYIYDVGLIDELIKWNEKGNFDRASSLLVGMFYMMDLISKPVVKQDVEDSHDSFFSRDFYV